MARGLESARRTPTALSIRNVVLIEALDLEFQTGLGVLTGETGVRASRSCSIRLD